MMEKHKCKLCLRSFSNGRALGGHMRSHVMNLPNSPKPNESPTPPPTPATVQLSFEAESASSPSSYSLRENPKRSFRFTDPNQFIDAGSIILQEDRGSETESSRNPTGPRSKRVKKVVDPMKNSVQTAQNESVSVLSSSSDITTEEDIAFCLILLSRDNNNNWKTEAQHHQHQEEQEDEQYEQQQVEEDEDEDVEEEEEEEEEESEAEFEEEEEEELKPLKKVRGRYKCDTCNKVFRSYQALGGHRASHKKNKQVAESGGEYSISQHDEKININQKMINVNNNISEKKIHECPICFREFSSGQALGGHKRTHGLGIGTSSKATTIAAVTTTTTNVEVVRSSANFGDSLLDLNLPAPMDEDGDRDDDDDDSQIEGSAVSDAEFVKPH